MDEETALRLLHQLRTALNVLDGAAQLAGPEMDLEVRRAIRRPIGEMILKIWDELIHPTLLTYPELVDEGDITLRSLRELPKK